MPDRQIESTTVRDEASGAAGTIGRILSANAADRRIRDRRAVACEGSELTFGELHDRANRIANALMERGAAPGDRVAVLGRNSADYIAIYFALARTGAIMVPVNFWHRESEVAYTLSQSGARWLLHQPRFETVARGAAARVAPSPARITFDGPLDGLPDLDTLAGAASGALPDVMVSPDDPHIILYTSGTTGFPKGATLSHRAHVAHAASLAEATDGRSDDVGAVIYPMFHTGGLDCVVLPHFVRGAGVVVLDGGDPDPILDAVETHGVTSIYCVPTVWRWILKRQAERQAHVSGVRRCLGSSDTFAPALLDDILNAFNADVYVTYGLTEAGCILTVGKLTRDHRAHIASVGCPMPGVEITVRDSEGRPVETGTVGEITARTPGAMDGYWEMPERTVEALRDGWLHTGDLARMDESGYVYLAGRSKDLIITGGENVYPLEVERLIKENPKVRDVAVVGIPDSEWGESVLAVVVPVEGASLTRTELTRFVGERAAGYKRPRFVEFVDELPVTTATGKVQKAVLKERYSDLGERRE